MVAAPVGTASVGVLAGIVGRRTANSMRKLLKNRNQVMLKSHSLLGRVAIAIVSEKFSTFRERRFGRPKRPYLQISELTRLGLAVVARSFVVRSIDLPTCWFCGVCDQEDCQLTTATE